MKTKILLVAMALFSTLNAQLSTCLAQGSLTPPGAPAPMMKTLAQIEPRTPISSAPFTITNAGSYYVTTNLTVSSGTAITIATNGVTLDLNGFSLRSTAASAIGSGISLNSGLRNITLANGFIQGGVTNNGSGFTRGNPFTPQGSQAAFIQSLGSVRQTLTFTAGSYAIGFAAAQRGNLVASVSSGARLQPRRDCLSMVATVFCAVGREAGAPLSPPSTAY